MTERTRVLLYLLAATVVVASCSRQPSPMAPERSETAAAVSLAAAGCPMSEQVAAEVKIAVQQACPPDGNYKNNGERNKCLKQAFNDAMKPYMHCFTHEEISEIRRLVMRGDSGPNGKPGEDEFHEEPGVVR